MTTPSFTDFSSEIVFNYSLKDDTTNIKYTGDFTIRRPNISRQLNIQKNVAKFKSDVDKLDESTEMIVYMLSFMKECIVGSPKWYTESNYLEEFFDGTIITNLFTRIQEELNKQIDGLTDKKVENTPTSE